MNQRNIKRLWPFMGLGQGQTAQIQPWQMHFLKEMPLPGLAGPKSWPQSQSQFDSALWMICCFASNQKSGSHALLSAQANLPCCGVWHNRTSTCPVDLSCSSFLKKRCPVLGGAWVAGGCCGHLRRQAAARGAALPAAPALAEFRNLVINY